jgi:hypothetical protein
MVAVAQRARLELERVQPGVRLGHREAGLVAAGDQRRQPARLLLVVAEHHHRVQPEDVHVHRRSARQAGPGGRDRLHHQRRLGDAQARAAPGLRHRDAQPAGIGQRLVELVREAAVAVLARQ